jgi:hypothetical protein
MAEISCIGFTARMNKSMHKYFGTVFSNMVQTRIVYIVLFSLGVNLVINGSVEFSFGQPSQSNSSSSGGVDANLRTNSLNLSQPIYQATNADFFASQNLSSKPFTVTKESVFEQAVMRDIGNVTNNMTFVNTYLPDKSIQAKGNGTIETEDGQTVDWISSDIGIINSKGFTFQGIVLFNATNSEKLSFLDNAIGIYKETPEVKRTIWLMD